MRRHGDGHGDGHGDESRRTDLLHDRLCRSYSEYKAARAQRPGDSVEYVTRLVRVIDCVEQLTSHLDGKAWLDDDE